jgi:plastocyanin
MSRPNHWPTLRWLTGCVAVLLAVATLTSCGTSDDTTSESGEAVDTIEITIEGDTVDPNGKRFPVAVGEPVTLVIDSDVAGELHVHSRPEQEVTFGSGTSEHQLTFDKPGIYPAESHDLHKVIVEFEVR